MAEVDRLRGVLARIEAMVWYEPQDDDDTVDAVRAMVRERDEARAEAKALQAEELARRTERDTARAEVERLERNMKAAMAIYRDNRALLDALILECRRVETERDAARAEVERLRAALAQAQRADE